MNKKIAKNLLTTAVVLAGCMMCFGCGAEKEDESTNSTTKEVVTTTQEVTTGVPTMDFLMGFDKIVLTSGENEVSTKEVDDLALIKALLSDVVKDDSAKTDAEGGYAVSVYSGDNVVLKMVIYEDKAVIEKNGTYVKTIAKDKYDALKTMLDGLK